MAAGPRRTAGTGPGRDDGRRGPHAGPRSQSGGPPCPRNAPRSSVPYRAPLRRNGPRSAGRPANGSRDPATARTSRPPDRPDPLALLEAQSANRVRELVPIRYGRMTESPFRFYRGAAAVMASDLARTPVSGIRAQLCGDAHLHELQAARLPERHLLFDINDFDETLPGPWEWDVKRLAASLVIAAPGERLHGQGAGPHRAGHGAVVPGVDDPVRGDAQSRRLVREDRRGPPQGHGGGQAARARAAGAWPARRRRPAPGTACRRSTSSPRWSTGGSGSRRIRPGRADRRPAARRGTRRDGAAVPRAPPTATAAACRRTGASLLADFQAVGHGPQGRRRGQRRHPLLDHPPARPGRRGSALPPGQGGRTLGTRRRTRGRARTGTRASGWWRASA